MGGFLTGPGSSPNDRKGQLLEEVRKREGKTLEEKDFQRLQLPMSPPVRSCKLGPVTQGSGVSWGQEKVQTQNWILQPHILENIEENTSAAVKSP